MSLGSAIAYGGISQGRIAEAHHATDWHWVQAAVKRDKEVGRDCVGEECRNSHAAPQLRTASDDERDPDQLPLALARTFLDTDDTYTATRMCPK